MIITYILCLFVVAIISYYNWTRRRLYMLSRQFKGNFALPLVGNSYILAGNNIHVLKKFNKYFTQYGDNDPIKFWMGTKLNIVFTNPDHLEKIMQSHKFSYKPELYDIIKTVAGEGLITASGPTYRRHKKVLAPLVNLNFTNSCYASFLKDSNMCMEDLRDYCNKGTFNIEPVINICFVKTISKTILGKDFDVPEEHQFIEDVISVYSTLFTRLARPWLQPEFIYQMTALSKKQKSIMQRIRHFFQETNIFNLLVLNSICLMMV